MSEQNTDLAIPTIGTDQSGLLDPSNRNVRLGFDPATAAGAVMLVQGTLIDVPKLGTLAKEFINVVAYMQHPASKNLDGGEVKEFIRTVVYTDDGKVYDCGSMGVEKSLAVLQMVCGKSHWEPAVKCKVVTRRLGSGKNWMVLEPDIKDLQARLSLVKESAGQNGRT